MLLDAYLSQGFAGIVGQVEGEVVSGSPDADGVVCGDGFNEAGGMGEVDFAVG